MKLTPLWPAAGPPIDTSVPGARDEIAALYGRPIGARSLRVNLVTTADGSALGHDGTSAPLTGGADRSVLGALRRLADVVLVGAATLRAEPGLLPRTAPLAVLTHTGDLGGFAIAPDREHGPIFVLGPEEVRSTVARTTTAPHEFLGLGAAESIDETLPSVLDLLAERGLHHVLCEGGPTLVAAFIRRGLVDELCLTTAPILGSGAGTSTLPAMESQAAPLLSVLVDEAGYVYTRRRLR